MGFSRQDNLRRAETKKKKEFNCEAWKKETSNTINFLKIRQRQRNTAQMKEQTRNTEVQINEEEIGSPGWMHETSARTWCTGKT